MVAFLSTYSICPLEERCEAPVELLAEANAEAKAGVEAVAVLLRLVASVAPGRGMEYG